MTRISAYTHVQIRPRTRTHIRSDSQNVAPKCINL